MLTENIPYDCVMHSDRTNLVHIVFAQRTLWLQSLSRHCHFNVSKWFLKDSVFI